MAAATGGRPLTVFGDDYPTPDGTCLRDFVHVSDLADAHLLALGRCVGRAVRRVYNLGNGRPISVRDVIAAVERVTGSRVACTIGPRRDGDPAVLFASSDRIRRELRWMPRFDSIDTIVETAWRWHSRRPTGTGTGASPDVAAAGVLADPRLSVVMPVFNERGTIDEIIGRVLAVPLRIELIVVDDGSTDGTRDRLVALQRERGFVLLLQPGNLGKGAALRAGFERVTGNVVVIQDADLEYSPEDYPQLLELIFQGRADVVYGSRFLGRHRVFLFTHYVGNRLLTLVTNILYNTMLTDMETCYKAMRVEVLRSFRLRSNGFGIEPEITAKIFKRNYRVYEVPITYDGRGYEEGKKITWRDGVVALWVLLKYRFTE